MHVDIYPEAPRLKAGEIGASVLEAEKKGRDWLRLRYADILIWGEVADANKKLRLRFTTAEGATAAELRFQALADVLLLAVLVVLVELRDKDGEMRAGGGPRLVDTPFRQPPAP
jgi:hypothetical protein